MSDENLSLNEAANQIGISIATLRNWHKQGLITIIDSVVKESEIDKLKAYLQSTESNKLKLRANKGHSTEQKIPVKLAGNSKTVLSIKSFVLIGQKFNLNTEALLLLASLNLLLKKGLIRYRKEDGVIISCLIQNPHINKIVANWPKSYNQQNFTQALDSALQLEIIDNVDFLGILYQSIQSEGEKSKMGAFYTPLKVSEKMCSSLDLTHKKILDPCCGSGNFLLSCKVNSPDQLFGCDIDSMAVNIAKINLILAFPDVEFEPQIVCQSLFVNLPDNFPTHFDLVIGNPPWGVHHNNIERKRLNELYPIINSMESFSYFILQAINLLVDGGKLSFLIPDSFLNSKRHHDIRKFLLENGYLYEVTPLGSFFDGVTSKVIILTCIKEQNSSQNIQINQKESSYPLSYKETLSRVDFTISVNSNPQDLEIIEKINNKEHFTLKTQALWALGIVTGNNSLFLTNHSEEDSSPVILGKDIYPHQIKESHNFLIYQPDKFQQSAPEEIYRAPEKLIYRFIAKRPVVAYDNQGQLTLNSANIFIPQLANYPLKIVAALFNSTIYAYLYQKRFAAQKVLRSHLEELPLPSLNQDEQELILDLLTNYQATFDKAYLNQIDKALYQIFDLTPDQIQQIEKEVI